MVVVSEQWFPAGPAVGFKLFSLVISLRSTQFNTLLIILAFGHVVELICYLLILQQEMALQNKSSVLSLAAH